MPRKVIWWPLRKLGVNEWIVRLAQGMSADARSRVRVDDGYSEEFEMNVGVQYVIVLSPPLFTVVFRALSRELLPSVPLENLYIAESLQECANGLLMLMEGMEWKD